MPATRLHANHALKILLRNHFQIVARESDAHSVPLVGSDWFLKHIGKNLAPGQEPLTRKFAQEGVAVFLVRPSGEETVGIYLQTDGFLSASTTRMLKGKTGLTFR